MSRSYVGQFDHGKEVGTFKFTNGKPIGGVYSGIQAVGLLSFPADMAMDEICFAATFENG